MPHNPQKTLGKAGAGLPRLQALILRHIAFPMLRLTLSWK
jgi:hypothetical protein